MTEEQKKRLEWIRNHNKDARRTSQIPFVVFLISLIDEQATEVSGLKEDLKGLVKESDERLAELNAARAEVERLKKESPVSGAEQGKPPATFHTEGEYIIMKSRFREAQAKWISAKQENQRLREALKGLLDWTDSGYPFDMRDKAEAALEGKDDTNTIKSKNFVTENQRLRKALKFYAGDHPWRVGNKVAIDALEGKDD